MYLVGWLHFLTLGKWPSVGGVLYIPAVHSSLVTRAVCSRGAPSVGCVGHSVVVGYVGGLVGCQALPCVEAAGCWLAWPGHEVADCGTQGGARASAGSLGVESVGLWPAHFTGE